MAKTLLMLTTILSLLITFSLHFQIAFSIDTYGDKEEYYKLDSTFPHYKSKSRFLATAIKKGAQCNPIAKNICNGVLANKGTELLQCCKKKCVNVVGDMNNCGQCGNKCKLGGERCCGGVCINILYNDNNCGKCNKKCKGGVRCRIGFCGYA
uniref:Protein GRIM REAPER-like n=1 Tax=Cicer arietinum TaxID=3827 RepID=A0A1S2XIM3_CICAR|nr:protein GRIM REAPER-like [Cicer arietinum]